MDAIQNIMELQHLSKSFEYKFWLETVAHDFTNSVSYLQPVD